MSASLVGSEMCIRDRSQVAHRSSVVYEWAPFRWFNPRIPESIDALVSVSYTHLTLPTICSV
eukprot:6830325-Alexandrium_andersonii.AAC.1